MTEERTVVNLMMLLEMAAEASGDRVGIVGPDGLAITYRQLFDQAAAAGAGFAESGAEKVGLLDVSSPALPVALFGAAWAGLPFVPLNYRLTDGELRVLAERISPAIFVVGDQTWGTLDHVPGIERVLRREFLATSNTGAALAQAWSSDPEQIAILLFTSGTTGTPKAAVLRHRHLVSYVIGSVEFMGASEQEATLVCVPPYHIAGIAALCSSIYAGRRIVQLANFDADAWIDLVRTEGVTHAMVVPTMLTRIVERLLDRGDGGLPTLRTMSYGGGKMPSAVIKRALELLPNTGFVNAYGLTETSSTIAVLNPDDHRDAMFSDDPAVVARLGSVGQPLPTLELSIRDPAGNSVGVGVSGEIWVRGEQISGEYLGHDSRVTTDGWLPTNDGGSLDAGGYLFLDGRLDDIIIRGGENISPGEIEDVLLSHSDIQDAAAVGVPSVQWGEVIAVAVVATEGVTVNVEEISSFMRERLRSSRTPEYVVVMDELPYNETGKLLRREIRARFITIDAEG